MFKKLFKKNKYSINLVAEFKPIAQQSEKLIASLSQYISDIVKNSDTVITDLQNVQAGYRIVFTITYSTNFFIRRNYTKKLSKFFYDFGNISYGCLVRYHYVCTSLT